jgi:hypothetical protein
MSKIKDVAINQIHISKFILLSNESNTDMSSDTWIKYFSNYDSLLTEVETFISNLLEEDLNEISTKSIPQE